MSRASRAPLPVAAETATYNKLQPGNVGMTSLHVRARSPGHEPRLLGPAPRTKLHMRNSCVCRLPL